MAAPALIFPVPSPGCHDLLFVTDDMRLEGLPASCVDSPLGLLVQCMKSHIPAK